MVIGKKSRLGLSRRAPRGPGTPARAPGTKPFGRDKSKRKRAPKQLPRAIVRAMEIPSPVPGGIHIMELESKHCRAIVGHGTDGLAVYCGAQKEGFIQARNGLVINSSYCIGHGDAYYRRDQLVREVVG